MSHEFKQSLKFPEHNQHQHQQQHQQQQQRLNIPLKTGGESLFLGTPGSNPGPTVSNMFNEHFSADGDFRSFSDLLMGSPAPASTGLTLVPDNWSNPNFTKPETDDESCGFKDKRPGKLVLPVQVSPVFNMSPGFSPSVFLTSPTFLSPSVSPYAMSPQQTLAQLTAQAHAALTGIQTEYHHQPSSSALPPSMTYQNPVFNTTSTQPVPDPPTALHTDRRPPTNMPINVDKPADDGYNWRKYGQKQVKGSEYPRSYYRCTSANCPVKKKVERSFDGHITEIIYKGQHNHEPPQHGRRGNKDGCLVDNGSDAQFRWSGGVGRDAESAQATSMLLNGPSDSEESGENYQVEDEDEDEDEPKAKRSAGTGKSDVPFTHRTMTEPKIVVQTRSEVDLLDDGYRWRKYGQKVVKGNPNPRSYYKCTTVGCKVRKHVERASTDMRAVITTYEGKHNHDVPAPRGSSINNNAANNIVAQQMKLHNSVVGQVDFGNRIHTPVALRLKQEQNLV